MLTADQLSEMHRLRQDNGRLKADLDMALAEIETLQRELAVARTTWHVKARAVGGRHRSQPSVVVRSAEGTRYAYSGRMLPVEFAQLSVLAVTNPETG